jgi:hypothetical protein
MSACAEVRVLVYATEQMLHTAVERMRREVSIRSGEAGFSWDLDVREGDLSDLVDQWSAEHPGEPHLNRRVYDIGVALKREQTGLDLDKAEEFGEALIRTLTITAADSTVLPDEIPWALICGMVEEDDKAAAQERYPGIWS